MVIPKCEVVFSCLINFRWVKRDDGTVHPLRWHRVPVNKELLVVHWCVRFGCTCWCYRGQLIQWLSMGHKWEGPSF